MPSDAGIYREITREGEKVPEVNSFGVGWFCEFCHETKNIRAKCNLEMILNY